MKALLILSILLLSGCGVTVTSNGNYLPSTTQSGGGSSQSTSGGSTSSSSPSPPAVTVNPTGIWDINDTVNGKPVTAVALIAGGKYYSLATADQFGCGDITGGTYTIEGKKITCRGNFGLMLPNPLVLMINDDGSIQGAGDSLIPKLDKVK